MPAPKPVAWVDTQGRLMADDRRTDLIERFDGAPKMVAIQEPLVKLGDVLTFKVRIAEMSEGEKGIGYWVTITNSNRPDNASIFDKTGSITPFMSYKREEAVHEAKVWARFLNADVEPGTFDGSDPFLDSLLEYEDG